MTSQNCDTFAIVPTTPDPADAPAAGVETGGPVTDSPGTCTCGATLRQFHRGLGPHSRPVTEPACPIAPDSFEYGIEITSRDAAAQIRDAIAGESR